MCGRGVVEGHKHVEVVGDFSDRLGELRELSRENTGGIDGGLSPLGLPHRHSRSLARMYPLDKSR